MIFESNFFSSQPETDMLLHRKCCTFQNSPFMEDAVHFCQRCGMHVKKDIQIIFFSLEIITAALFSIIFYTNAKILS